MLSLFSLQQTRSTRTLSFESCCISNPQYGIEIPFSPIPFIRVDALLLNILWFLPYFPTQPNQVSYAWKIAACFIPISFGWAAGDVSLAAYIQASLARVEAKTVGVSALGAVMAFLYVVYVSTSSPTVNADLILGLLDCFERRPLCSPRKICGRPVQYPQGRAQCAS